MDRRFVYVLLTVIVAGAVAGRIIAVQSIADNDRSRWDTIRALVDDGTYVIGHRVEKASGGYVDEGIAREENWQTIDKVMNPETKNFYSSKPPLLPTMLAGEYWVLKKLLGWSIVDQNLPVVRAILLTVNWAPLIVYLILFACLVEKLGTSDWGKLYVFAAACFGTFLTTYAVVLNNHTVATCSVLFALFPFVGIWQEGRRSPDLFFMAGFFAGFAACTELPAVAFAAALLILLFLRAPWPTLCWSVPALLFPVAGFFLTNYLAMGTFAPAYSKFGGPWYEFPGSHWLIEPGQVKTGIDWAYLQEGRLTYGFHVLFGHHGLLSLTPVFVFSLAGMALAALRLPTAHRPLAVLPLAALLTLVLTIIVAGFYIFVVQGRERNYGGWANGPRWLMWLTPLLLITMIPVVDRLGPSRWGRRLAYLFLAVSVMSVTYREWNPWRHPWLYELFEAAGWIHY
jgi:hypothetical protein